MNRHAQHLAEEVLVRCSTLATFSEDSGSLRRTFLSASMRDVHREIASWLEPLGVRARIDAAGNLRALYPAAETSAPRLLIGSHLDTVPNAGAYDGMLGVVLPIALLEAVAERTLPYAIEIIGFSEEEGVRFGRPFIGSNALVGTLDEELLVATDAQGTSVREAIAQFGLNPTEIPDAALDENAVAFLEFHIEQGPVLEKLGLPLAAVDAIVGQSRCEIVFQGRANHAGTTPMSLRFDAVAAAAEWISLVENTAKTTTGLVATVGSIQTKPGAVNVIAGEARVSLDIRHRTDEVRTRALAVLVQGAQEIARRRGLSLRCTEQMHQVAVALDSALTVQIEQAIQKTGSKPHRMVSGAGHDAMILASKIPSAMIFLRTPDGVSHDPAETVAVDDIAKGIECGLHLLEQLAADAAFQKRTSRE